MKALSPEDILDIWESCAALPLPEKALFMLKKAFPDEAVDTLSSLCIGERDRRLFLIREAIFGSRIEAVAICTHCGESLEFELSIFDLRAQDHPFTFAENYIFHSDQVEMSFRLPNSLDLIAVASLQDQEQVTFQLARRCVDHASFNGNENQEEFADDLLHCFSERMIELDPQADLLVNLVCPLCGHQKQAAFDIVSFLWSELSRAGKSLLHEVSCLAHAYGWQEKEILSMKPVRRRAYLDLLT